MKAIKFLAAALVMASFVACGSNNTAEPQAEGEGAEAAAKPVNPKQFLPKQSEIDSVSYLIGINFGSFIKGYNFGSDLNYAMIKKGMLDFINSKGNQNDPAFVEQFKIDPNMMNELFNNFLEKRSQYVSALNTEKENKYLAANAKKAGVQVSPSGLQYIINNEGNSVKAGPQDTVYVHYKGTLTDGTVFDQTQPEQSSVMLLMNRVIAGWTEGIQLVGEGGDITLYVPSKLGYGERGTNGIEPNSTLIFNVQVDSVKHFVAPVKE